MTTEMAEFRSTEFCVDARIRCRAKSFNKCHDRLLVFDCICFALRTMSADSPNLGIAFGLVIGAGAATGLGAAVVFVPALVRLASRRTLAAALGLSAGVMVYVSFVEIFQKSTIAFEDSGFDFSEAHRYAALCFFGGVIFMGVRIQGSVFCSAFGSLAQDVERNRNQAARRPPPPSSRSSRSSRPQSKRDTWSLARRGGRAPEGRDGCARVELSVSHGRPRGTIGDVAAHGGRD